MCQNENILFRERVVEILKEFGQTGASMALNICFVAAILFKNNETNTERAEIIRKALDMEHF